MTKLSRWSLLCLAGLACACENLPQPDEADTRQAAGFHRGHKPKDSAAENLSLEPHPGNYPPRALGLASQTKPPSDSWLLDADSDHDRWRRLEVVVGGLDRSMWEIGLRFIALHDAIGVGDFALAEFEWDKVRRALEIAILERPRGQDIIEKGFLEGTWRSLKAAIETREPGKIRTGFGDARRSCMACHTTLNREFLNRGRVFQATETFREPAAPASPGGER